MPAWFTDYNSRLGTSYSIVEQPFPLGEGNDPYNYWDIWVNSAGSGSDGRGPRLESLTQEFDVIIFKHCYPVSDIEPDTGYPDISSSVRRIENYKLQYEALKEKMREFPGNRFIVWTGAALVRNTTTEEKGRRAHDFFEWMKNEWDVPGDNIYIWDFYQLETDGGYYLKDEYAESPYDSHPNQDFSARVAPYLCNRILNVIEGSGDFGSLTGQ